MRAALGTLVMACAAAATPAAAVLPIRLVDDRQHVVELAAPAERIVTLLPSLAELVCELDACERLVGTDRHANWPVAVQRLPKLGGLEVLAAVHATRLSRSRPTPARSP